MRLTRHTFRRTTLISVTSVSLLLGLALAQLGWNVPLWLCVALLPFMFFARRKTFLALVLVVAVGFLFGLHQGSLTKVAIANYNAFYSSTVELTGKISEDPTYNDKRQSVWYIQDLTIRQDGQQRKMPGKARITTLSIAEVRRGDMVTVQGKLRDGFGNYQASIYFATLKQHTPSQSWIDTMRYQFATGVYNVLPEPHASLGLGFLTGLKSQLPDDLNDQLRALALTHIVVASGYNLTILIRLSRKLLARNSKFQALVGSVGLMLGMLAITGMSPSMTRAGLVTGLALAAWYYGRNVHPVVLLLLAAAITAFWNPLYLWSDAGWWLSFSAFAGVLLVAPLLENRFIKPDAKFKTIKQIAVETTAAQLTTLPVILLLFGQLALFGLLANILVVPLVPIAMLLTFAAGLGGIFLPQLGAWIAIPAHLVLAYIVGIVRFLTQIPWTTMILQTTWSITLVLYVCIGAASAIAYTKLGHSYRKQRSIVE